MAAKMSESEYRQFQEKTGYKEPVLQQQETAEKRNKDLDILLAVGTVQDRQALEYWSVINAAREKREREAEEDRQDARERQRAINRAEILQIQQGNKVPKQGATKGKKMGGF